MKLTDKQTGVLIRIVIGALTTLVVVTAGLWINPFSFDETLSDTERLGVAIKSSILPGIFLALSIGRLAKHRFFTPEDIDGGSLSEGTEQARILQSLLQNTLEQLCLALLVYLVWAVTMPATWLSVIPLAAITFTIGRILFFSGYKYGASARAIGFALTFYPSLFLLLIILCHLGWQFIS